MANTRLDLCKLHFPKGTTKIVYPELPFPRKPQESCKENPFERSANRRFQIGLSVLISEIISNICL